jgi:translation initiation factor 3 subunit E
MAEKYDLTPTISKFIDPHLIFPLVEFLAAKNLYSHESIQRARVKFLQQTYMVDYTMNIHSELPDFNDEIKAEYTEKRGTVVNKLLSIQTKCQTLIQIFNRDVMQNLCQERDSKTIIEKLEKEHAFNKEQLEDLYDYSKVLYEIGNYTGATEQLQIVTTLVSPNTEKYASALWGRLACSILVMDWDTALDDLMRLKDHIENHLNDSPLKQLTSRTSLIHWALFVFFNHPKGKDMLIDWFLSTPANLNAIQTAAPHLLRYLTVCVIISTKRRKGVLKDVVKIIQLLSHMYRDPITEFLECLYVHHDFDGAQEKLKKCDLVLMYDFFLVACNDDFTENARLLIFEIFCRIHNCVSIKMLSEKLNMTEDEAEHWMVNLIRNARLDAKIDSQLGHVVMGFTPSSVYQQIIERTNNIAYNTQKLITFLEKRLGLKNPDAFD